MNSFKKILLVIYILGIGCSTKETFPDVYVNESIYIYGGKYYNVHSPLGYEYITGGVGGIIIAQGLNNEFIAYDRACTFEMNSDCVISGKSENDPVLSCEGCCNSKFVIVDGSVLEGSANQALRRYNTYFDGQILYITN